MRARWFVSVAASVLCLAMPAAAQTRSPSGAFRLDLAPVTDAEGDDLRVLVRRDDGALVAAIEPNPGGNVPATSFRARFVAGDNLLLSWGCGTYCASAVLVRADGHRIADLGHVDVSPSGELALVYSPFDSAVSGVVEVIALRTGEIVSSRESEDAWNTCAVRWDATRVRLLRCDTRTPRAVVVPLSPHASAPNDAALIDVDFDGDPDAVRSRGPCTGNCYFDVWLRRDGRFVFSPALSALANPILDRSTRTVLSFESEGLGGARFRVTRYTIRGGRPERVSVTTQRDEPAGSGTFRRTVHTYRSGREREVCSAVVEGGSADARVTRIDLGSPGDCDLRLDGEWIEADR
ncbi:hypothetical protein [Sandaracinus amylolyticus]|uniref:hypothetical protein n=1 Tax=Sandaracinus amylolyticus TaxID=927083 RepID=UPI001F1847CD|nr:hypothetical protein [Sandaracinus amylolyticus]UJR83521.1 Hypothetical protein I5071_55890 [Sandaracinus amylolyticus]